MMENNVKKQASRITGGLFALLSIEMLLEEELGLFSGPPYDSSDTIPIWAPLIHDTANWCSETLNTIDLDVIDLEEFSTLLAFNEILPRTRLTKEISGSNSAEALWLATLKLVLDDYLSYAPSCGIIVLGTPAEQLRNAIADHVQDYYHNEYPSAAYELADTLKTLVNAYGE